MARSSRTARSTRGARSRGRSVSARTRDARLSRSSYGSVAAPPADTNGSRNTAASSRTGATRSGTRSSRAARRRRRRNRSIGLVSALVVVLLAGFAGAWTLLRSDDAPAPEQAAPATTIPRTTTAPPAPTLPPKPPGSPVATTNGGDLGVFASPSDAAPLVTTLSSRTEYDLPRTLLVINEDTPGWLQVSLPLKPNGQTGWIHANEVTLGRVTHRVEVDLASHMLRLFNLDQLILETPVAVGAPGTPTPTGTFYVTDPVPGGGGSYGPWALGLSGYSDVLESFAGGPPQIALHGTNRPDLIGQSVSNGCVRVPNDMITEIHAQVPLGTPVIIT